MRQQFDIREASRKLNGLRILMGNKGLTESDFRRELKRVELPSNTLFWSEFVKAGIAQKSEDKYEFVDPKTPIHFSKLQAAYNAYRHRAEYYSKRHQTKQRSEKQLKSKEVSNAVKLLTGLGFQVYAPVGTLYAKL